MPQDGLDPAPSFEQVRKILAEIPRQKCPFRDGVPVIHGLQKMGNLARLGVLGCPGTRRLPASEAGGKDHRAAGSYAAKHFAYDAIGMEDMLHHLQGDDEIESFVFERHALEIFVTKLADPVAQRPIRVVLRSAVVAALPLEQFVAGTAFMEASSAPVRI